MSCKALGSIFYFPSMNLTAACVVPRPTRTNLAALSRSTIRLGAPPRLLVCWTGRDHLFRSGPSPPRPLILASRPFVACLEVRLSHACHAWLSYHPSRSGTQPGVLGPLLGVSDPVSSTVCNHHERNSAVQPSPAPFVFFTLPVLRILAEEFCQVASVPSPC